MNTCKTCKWWGVSDASVTHVYDNARICGHPKNQMTFESQSLLCASDCEIPRKPTASDCGNILDGSGYWGALFPGPDFGCVHHEGTA